jgi:hypothetical protein
LPPNPYPLTLTLYQDGVAAMREVALMMRDKNYLQYDAVLMDNVCTNISHFNNIYIYLKTVFAELQSQIKILTKTKSHMYIDVTS